MTAFDTLAFAERLESAGFDPKLSKALSHAMQDVAMQDVATKADLIRLRADIRHDGLIGMVALASFMIAAIGLMLTFTN